MRLTLKEFEALLQQSEILHYLSVLELDIRDARVLFHILADGDETLSVEEFCGGIAKVRGNAKSVDIVPASLLKIILHLYEYLNPIGNNKPKP